MRTVFGFYRGSDRDPWKLRSFKVVLPTPRGAAEGGARPVVVPAPAPKPSPEDSPASHLPPRDASFK